MYKREREIRKSIKIRDFWSTTNLNESMSSVWQVVRMDGLTIKETIIMPLVFGVVCPEIVEKARQYCLQVRCDALRKEIIYRFYFC